MIILLRVYWFLFCSLSGNYFALFVCCYIIYVPLFFVLRFKINLPYYIAKLYTLPNHLKNMETNGIGNMSTFCIYLPRVPPTYLG